MTLMVPEGEHFELMDKVALMKMKGKSDTAIGKDIGLTRTQVKDLYAEYKDILVNDSEMRDRARDALHVMVEHYDKLIAESYEILTDLKGLAFDEKVANQMTNAVKTVADLESKRLDAWQKAGMLEGADLGDELAAREEREEMIISILRDDLCAECRLRVMRKVSMLTGQVESTVVYDDDDE